MPGNCVVRGCGGRGGFSFPSEPKLRLKWKIAIKRENWDPSTYSVVCADHFVADDYRETLAASCSRNLSVRRYLKKEAVPSVFPWGTDIFDPNSESKSLNEVPNHLSEDNNQDDIMEDLPLENRQEYRTEAEVTPAPMPVFDSKEEGINELPIDEASIDGFDDTINEYTPHDRLLNSEANVIEDMKKGNQNSMPPMPSSVIPHPSLDSDRPRLSYSAMIAEALNQAENKMMSLEEIYIYISQRYPFYRMEEKNWQNSVRHNLSLNPSFYKVPRPINSTGRGKLWTTNNLQNAGTLAKRVWLIENGASDTSDSRKHSKSSAMLKQMKQNFLCRLCHSTLPNRSLWYNHYYECKR